jgi:hypothetical protein
MEIRPSPYLSPQLRIFGITRVDVEGSKDIAGINCSLLAR